MQFRVLEKGNLVDSAEIPNGCVSKSSIDSILRSQLLHRSKSSLQEFVESFANGRRKKKKYYYVASKIPVRFTDPEKKEQGYYIGDWDLLIMATEQLSDQAAEFLINERNRVRK